MATEATPPTEPEPRSPEESSEKAPGKGRLSPCRREILASTPPDAVIGLVPGNGTRSPGAIEPGTGPSSGRSRSPAVMTDRAPGPVRGGAAFRFRNARRQGNQVGGPSPPIERDLDVEVDSPSDRPGKMGRTAADRPGAGTPRGWGLGPEERSPGIDRPGALSPAAPLGGQAIEAPPQPPGSRTPAAESFARGGDRPSPPRSTPAMAEWEKKTLQLEEGHGGLARPGYNVLVADRGAVRFDYPEDWVIVPAETGSIRLHDRLPPDDDCTLQMTVFHLNPEVDWSSLPLRPLIEKLLEDDARFVLDRGEVVSFRRGRLEVAWSEIRFMDPSEARPAYSRTCIARCREIQPLITFDYWESDARRCREVWETVLATLRLGETITEPEIGPDRLDHRLDRGEGTGPGHAPP
ncbi:hypothetical protein [Tautonia sociabilis]|uniref:Uncharacterized protein n=1 Tax=Tautonia sociabilis TaxID=2080755 RepID=A0A432MFM3_9BACT|nr:hypothetical protein [Tautonia sociabilis]RUL85038.1 hypothetical protein TsocGM_19035 [Tautonia sociabilis]